MEFLHLGLLVWFLPLAALPIVLHLLTLHRLKTVELSTFRFLFDSYVQQRRRMRFLEALLAALRTLFLLLLVLAIARPTVRHWQSLFGGGSGRDVVMLVDCSASMNAVTAGTLAIHRAKKAAIEVAGRLGPSDRLTLIRVASQPVQVFSRFSSDAETIRQRIESLEVTPSRANLLAALSHVFGSGAQDLVSPVVYVFTDRQASGFSEMRDGLAEKLIPPGSSLIVVNVGSSEEVPNRAVVGTAPSEQRALVGLPIILRPRVANHSKTETEEVAVSVLVNEKEVARKRLILKAGETLSTEIVYTPSEPGPLRGRFEISADRFPADDTFLFTLTVEPQVKVLLVNGNPAADVFENASLYLRTAMMTGGEEDAETVASPATESDKKLARSLAVQDIPEASLTAAAVEDSDVVILANCGTLAVQHFTWLRDFVTRGGGLMIFPGDKVNPEVYNTQFFPVPGVPDGQLTSARLGPPEGDPEDAATFERFAVIDFAHPVLSVFDNRDERYLTKVNVARRFPLTLPAERGNTWPLAEFSGGVPALVESRLGEGRVLLAAFPISAKWTNLPLKPEFVPLVLRMVGHVNHRPDLEGPTMVQADTAAEFMLAESWAPAEGKVADVAGRSTSLEFKRSGSRLLGAFERTSEKGYYTLQVRGNGGDKLQQAALSFAVNLAPGESDFAKIGDEQIREMLPDVELKLVDASAEAQQVYGSIGNEREVWRPLIFFLFAVIGIEFMLSTLGGQNIDTERPTTVSQRILDLRPGTWVGRMTGAGSVRERT